MRFAAILSAFIAGHASAQRPVVSPAQSNAPPQAPRRVDQTVADINPLSASLRVMQPDQRQATGFFDVMEVPGRPDLLMRANGEVYAVFPRSEYVVVTGGIMPVIPANTIFYIGKPPSVEAIGKAFTTAMNERSTREETKIVGSRRQDDIRTVSANRRTENQQQAREPDSPPPFATDPDAPDTRKFYELAGPVTMVTDHAYRLTRLQELLQRAAKADKDNATSATKPAVATK
jgi:hypothetical protein